MRDSSSGVSRKVDDLGRIVLPSELRKSFDIREGDLVDIAVYDETIVLSKRRDACAFCRGTEGLRRFRDRPVCASCIGELKRL